MDGEGGSLLSSTGGPIVQMLEYDVSEMLGDGWRRVIAKADASRVADMMAHLRAGTCGSWVMTNHGRRGEKVHLLVTGMPIGGRIGFRADFLKYDSSRRYFRVIRREA